MTHITRKQLQAIHARKNQILIDRTIARKNEILREIDKGEQPFTVKHSKEISQSDLIGMQRAAGVR